MNLSEIPDNTLVCVGYKFSPTFSVYYINNALKFKGILTKGELIGFEEVSNPASRDSNYPVSYVLKFSEDAEFCENEEEMIIDSSKFKEQYKDHYL